MKGAKNKGSAVCRYTTLATPRSSMATCNICKANVSRGAGSTAKYNTTNFNHFQKRHAKEHDDSHHSFPHSEEYSFLILHRFTPVVYIGQYPKPGH